MNDELLAELAELAGIGLGYVDAWGDERTTSDATRRDLLAAMGVDVSDERALRAGIAERRARPWRRVLPPVHVVRDHHPLSLPVTLEIGALEQPYRWRLRTEQGPAHEGEFVPAALPQRGEAEVDGERRRGVLLELPLAPGLGYHDVEIEPPAGASARTRLIVCPESCHVATGFGRGERVWGLAVQLYALRAPRDWGMGDFTNLSELAGTASRLGASVIGLNPLHALRPHAPAACAPYSPSSRLFLNILYIDPMVVPELADAPAAQALMADPGFAERLCAARGAELIDYPAVAALKRPVLEALFGAFRQHHLDAGTARDRAFSAFRAQGGAPLRRHALFEALAEHLAGASAGWPEAFQDPESAEVAAFAEAHAERIRFFEYLQWLADEQLAAADGAARDAGLALGLYRDLAVSAAGDGAEVWSNPDLYALGASVGAPPDAFNLRGQDWGLPPMIPERLAAAEYAPFIEVLRRNMRHAGALRIDHAMALFRLYWVPQGHAADDGAYVHYPLSDLLGILALESRRNRCMIIGEDLGTVPEEVSAAFEPAEVQSYRLLYFERAPDDGFCAPGDYPQRALAAIGTHDLPTLAGYWAGHDLLLREELDLFPSDEVRAAQFEQRARDREALFEALRREHLLPADAPDDPTALGHPDGAFRRAVHRYLARAPSRILMVQPEDVLGQLEQVNLPGSTEGHPNWRRRYPVDDAAIGDHPEFRALAAALAEEGRGPLT